MGKNTIEVRIQNILLPNGEICGREDLYFHRGIENGYGLHIFRREKELKEKDPIESYADNTLTSVVLSKEETITFDSYFGGLSIDKWKKYSAIRRYSLMITVKGKIKAELISLSSLYDPFHNKNEWKQMKKEHNHYSIDVLTTVETDAIEPTQLHFDIPDHAKGMVTIRITALDDGASFEGGYYAGEIDEDMINEVNLAINICTFKRESFIDRNLKLLHRYILNDSSNELSEHLHIYISDNGRSLPINELSNDKVHIVPNKNVGGAGGFTRGLIEIRHHMEQYPATHALMMDDDIVIQPEALYRTYMILKCRKQDYLDLHVGGAMLALGQCTKQVESGAYWNAGALISFKQGLYMDSTEDCLLNEIEEFPDYNAWWYSCVPMHLVTEDNLPLPIFIRGDDVEYGIRNMKDLFLLNGICVWHMAFENKVSSSQSYYIIRNQLYDNSLHYPKYSAWELIRYLCHFVPYKVLHYQYKDAALTLRAVEDFYKGVPFLVGTDGELLNQDIMAAGYKNQTLEELGVDFDAEEAERRLSNDKSSQLKRFLIRFMLWGYLLPTIEPKDNSMRVVTNDSFAVDYYRQKTVLCYDKDVKKGYLLTRDGSIALKLICRTIALSFKTLVSFNRKKRQFKQEAEILMTESFWMNYLNI